MSVVVDASVIVAVVVEDGRQEAARARLEGWLAAGGELHAPAVLPNEVADVLAGLVFEDALNIDEVRDVWVDLAALGLILHPFHPIQDGPDVAAITTQLRRRHATDSTYVALRGGSGLSSGPWTPPWPAGRPIWATRPTRLMT